MGALVVVVNSVSFALNKKAKQIPRMSDFRTFKLSSTGSETIMIFIVETAAVNPTIHYNLK